jgi:hypothetical protein
MRGDSVEDTPESRFKSIERAKAVKQEALKLQNLQRELDLKSEKY